MALRIVLLLSLAISPASLLPQPTVIDIDTDIKDIPEINQGLNLLEGDIMVDKTQKSATLNLQSRWNGTVPYVLNNSLSMNDKGVILKAFEQMRLKACVDFKPRTTEEDYVSVESLTGCWSFIGRVGGKQQLSIGEGCGYIAIVEHEFLHCLGFFHEQSRYDRDDYVTIIAENIIAANRFNFDKASQETSTIQGTPYDYMSVMHYGQDAFSNGNGNTIITKNTKFQDVIGQSNDMSPTDTFELNKLYNCTKSLSFLDRCSFENSMCQMANCSSTANGWQMASNVSGGPFSDHSNLLSIGDPAVYKNNTVSEPSSFMHFSTKTGQTGYSGRLESREITPRQSCHVQCLEFFYYHSGNETDQLNIWIREYQNNSDTVGNLRLMDQITGPPTDRWQLRLVPLDASKTFLVEFEARKGAGNSKGGFSVDDINLSESECPHNVWQIENFMEIWNTSTLGSNMYSPLYYSPEGYRYQLILQLNSNYFSIFVRLVSGVYDDRLQWPCPWRQVTFMVLEQNPDIRNRTSKQASITTNPTQITAGKYQWGRPSEAALINNETVNVTAWSYISFVEKARLGDREFVKGGALIVLVSMQDISSLQQNNSLPCPSVAVKNFNVSQDAQPKACIPREGVIVHPSIALLLALALLVAN
ncbi:meprin A subunit beta-like [Salminus brasiliensis]|uniref:meprin A subunit beta-like n=1 Tax=Salminus brasiliensis TaxID=930266 RepID=UPI003B830FEF